MKLGEYLQADAVGLAECVARGEIGAGELLDLALRQNAVAQPKTNAICRLMEDEARSRLKKQQLAGPFAGVPFLIKDCAQDYAGLPTSYGSRSMLGVTAPEHAHVVRRYLDAGLVIFGKTNLPEFALKGVSDSQLFGRANNPWNVDHTPGGSSGGAAAAVASGVVPMAAGNDGGGSIRIPAACCGLFGLRPSRARISSGPAFGEYWYGASSEGVLSRSVRDTAAALTSRQAESPAIPLWCQTSRPYAQLMRRDPGKLRIGFSAASPIGTEVHPEAVAAVNEAAKLLASLGHEVVEAAPEIDGAALAKAFLHVYFGRSPAMVAQARAAGARTSDFELLTRVLTTLGGATSAASLTAQLLKWNEFGRALARFHARYDLMLTPTLAHPPIRHGQGDPTAAEQAVLNLLDRAGVLGLLARAGLLDGTIDKIARDSLQYVPFTQLANLTGTPAMSVPLHWTKDGLPLGVQFVARFGEEDRLLQLAAQLETARPWFARLPAWVTQG